MLGFAEAQCSNEETASPEGCKELLDEEEFVTERKNYISRDLRRFILMSKQILVHKYIEYKLYGHTFYF